MKVHINAQGREVSLETDSKTAARVGPLVDKAFSLWMATAPSHHPTGFAAGAYADTQTVETL